MSAPAKQLLFLCTGNYYRSRFAEIYFNWLVEQRGPRGWMAVSRGLEPDPRNPGPMSVYTLQRLATHGISAVDYQRLPLPVTVADLQQADHIVAVKEAEHRAMLARGFAEHLPRVEFWHVHDLDVSAPPATLDHLEREVHALFERLHQV